MRILIVVAFIAIVILLQIYLSKRETKWPGLVLPIMAFLFGLLFPLNTRAPSDGVTVGIVFQMLLLWLLGNIPTIALLAIYFGCRSKQRRNSQIDKMIIQDLD